MNRIAPVLMAGIGLLVAGCVAPRAPIVERAATPSPGKSELISPARAVMLADQEVRRRGLVPQGGSRRSEVKRIKGYWAVGVDVIQADGSQELSDFYLVLIDDYGKLKGFIPGM